MKQLFLIAALFTAVCSFAQNTNSDAILHKWEMQDKSEKVFFRKSGNKYEAVQIYGKQMLEADGKTYMKDVNNPDPSLRDRKLDNYILIKNLAFKNDKWTGGKLYYYKDGKSYDVTITIKENVLYMRIYKGIPKLGRTTEWNMADQ